MGWRLRRELRGDEGGERERIEHDVAGGGAPRDAVEAAPGIQVTLRL